MKKIFSLFSILFLSLSVSAQTPDTAFVQAASNLYQPKANKNGIAISATAPLPLFQKADNKMKWIEENAAKNTVIAISTTLFFTGNTPYAGKFVRENGSPTITCFIDKNGGKHLINKKPSVGNAGVQVDAVNPNSDFLGSFVKEEGKGYITAYVDAYGVRHAVGVDGSLYATKSSVKSVKAGDGIAVDSTGGAYSVSVPSLNALTTSVFSKASNVALNNEIANRVSGDIANTVAIADTAAKIRTDLSNNINYVSGQSVKYSDIAANGNIYYVSKNYTNATEKAAQIASARRGNSLFPYINPQTARDSAMAHLRSGLITSAKFVVDGKFSYGGIGSGADWETSYVAPNFNDYTGAYDSVATATTSLLSPSLLWQSLFSWEFKPGSKMTAIGTNKNCLFVSHPNSSNTINLDEFDNLTNGQNQIFRQAADNSSIVARFAKIRGRVSNDYKNSMLLNNGTLFIEDIEMQTDGFCGIVSTDNYSSYKNGVRQSNLTIGNLRSFNANGLGIVIKPIPRDSAQSNLTIGNVKTTNTLASLYLESISTIATKPHSINVKIGDLDNHWTASTTSGNSNTFSIGGGSYSMKNGNYNFAFGSVKTNVALIYWYGRQMDSCTINITGKDVVIDTINSAYSVAYGVRLDNVPTCNGTVVVFDIDKFEMKRGGFPIIYIGGTNANVKYVFKGKYIGIDQPILKIVGAIPNVKIEFDGATLVTGATYSIENTGGTNVPITFKNCFSNKAISANVSQLVSSLQVSADVN